MVGIGGLVFPQALGVGYDVIGSLLQGNVAIRVIWGVLLVKSIIWAVSLGSGTSGGVLAPLLTMGGALGGIEALFLPNEGTGFWPLPLLVAAVIAHGFTVLTLKRSILTEKVSRRGFHLSREYWVDPLEILSTREVMRTGDGEIPEAVIPPVAYPDEPLRVVVYRMAETGLTTLPVVERADPARPLGVISLEDLLRARVRNLQEEHRRERVLRFNLPFPRE